MANENYVGRFAPSPTGPLHFGSLVAALASYLDARHAQGRWLVRIEDVDGPRCRKEWGEAQLATLAACGLTWDGEVVWQSARTPAYTAAIGELSASGQVYACTCSRKELADSALHPGAPTTAPVYPGTCRDLNRNAANAALRVRVPNKRIGFTDRLQGEVSQELAQDCGDFIVRRKDGLFAYQLAVVVDDAWQGVTDVVRGADLLDSTPRQIALQQQLALPTPHYLHLPVAVDANGQKLSKQTLAPALGADDAVDWLTTALAYLGQPEPDTEARRSPSTLVAAAVRQWNPARIPARLTQPLPPKFPVS